MKQKFNIVRVAKTGYFALSAAFCILGIIFMLWPETATVVSGRIFGIVLIVFGIVKIIGYMSKDLFRLAFQYDVELGILSIVLGVVLLFKAQESLYIIFVIVGIMGLVDALFKVRIAMDSKKFGISLWWLIMILAVLTGVVGILLVLYPWESAQVIAVILGISLIADGVLNLCVALCTINSSKFIDGEVVHIEDDI